MEAGQSTKRRRRRAVVAALALLLAGAPYPGMASAPAAPVRNPDGIAVIIGNRTYEHERVPAVQYAHRDAAAFRRYVVDVLGFDPENVIYKQDTDKATLEGVFGNQNSLKGSELWRYLHPAGHSDVVVFYSGHGIPGLHDKRGYLLPVNAHPDRAELNGYPIDVLYQNLSKLKEQQQARSVQVFLDACFSGESDKGLLIKSTSAITVAPRFPAQEARLTVLTAASGTEVASWDHEAQHGLFTQHLLDALYGGGDADGNGRVTAAEAKAYLDRHMTRAARKQYGRDQHASFQGVATTVLARAETGGQFPARPVLAKLVAKDESDQPGPPGNAPATPPAGSEPSPSAPLEQVLKEVKELKKQLSELQPSPAPSTAPAPPSVVAQVRPYTAPQRTQARPGQVIRDCAECPELVVVPAGSFLMGSPASEAQRDDNEGPQHQVAIPAPFAVGRYEVTFAEWDACVAAGGCTHHRPGDQGWGRRTRPVINVSWHDAQEYVQWLSRKTGQAYRLLSEAEWEYVARAGTTTAFHTGGTISPDQANYYGKSTYGSGRKGVYRKQTVPVGTFEPNGFGVYDVHGNVYEWVEDCWNESYAGAPSDGSAWTSGDCSRRVLRGGSWGSIPGHLRSALRSRLDSVDRGVQPGFRVIRTLTP